MKHLGLLIVTALGIAGCAKDKTPEYPDCFAEISSTHVANISFGGSQVVYLSDTTALTFYIDHEGMDLNEACRTLDVNNLNEKSHISYYQWTLHPDSIPPDLTSDVLYPNTSSFRFWYVTSGALTTSVSTPEEEGPHHWRQISVQLSNIVFDRSQDGLPTVTIDNLVVKDANTF